MIKAFIFDFDGLMIDTEYSSYQTWLEIYQKYQIDLPMSEWIKCVGSSNDDFDPIRYLRTKTKVKLDENRLRKEQLIAHKNISETMPVLPGVKEFIQFAKQNHIMLAVASSSSYRWVSTHLVKKNLLSLFDLIVTADDVDRVKPAPDLFIKVKEGFGLEDYEGIVFEDSAHGIEAAKIANLYTVAVPNQITKNLNFDKADILLDSLNSITPNQLLNQLNN
jgi:HAD superfamily hydrolase (TIGR01509 family)